MFCYLVVLVGVMFGIASFSYEESCHWNRYVAAMPLSIRQIVLARYGSTAICAVTGVAASVILAGISFATGNASFTVLEWTLWIAQCCIGSVQILIPVLYRFDAERGRIAMLVIFVAVFALFGAGMELGAAPQAALAMILPYLTLILTIAVFALLPVSVGMAVRIRANKEFGRSDIGEMLYIRQKEALSGASFFRRTAAQRVSASSLSHRNCRISWGIGAVNAICSPVMGCGKISRYECSICRVILL